MAGSALSLQKSHGSPSRPPAAIRRWRRPAEVADKLSAKLKNRRPRGFCHDAIFLISCRFHSRYGLEFPIRDPRRRRPGKEAITFAVVGNLSI